MYRLKKNVFNNGDQEYESGKSKFCKFFANLILHPFFPTFSLEYTRSTVIYSQEWVLANTHIKFCCLFFHYATFFRRVLRNANRTLKTKFLGREKNSLPKNMECNLRKDGQVCVGGANLNWQTLKEWKK